MFYDLKACDKVYVYPGSTISVKVNSSEQAPTQTEQRKYTCSFLQSFPIFALKVFMFILKADSASDCVAAPLKGKVWFKKKRGKKGGKCLFLIFVCTFRVNSITADFPQ